MMDAIPNDSNFAMIKVVGVSASAAGAATPSTA
jgi:hypothetical protein